MRFSSPSPLRYRTETGALSNRGGLRTAQRLVRAGQAADPIRARLALAGIRRLKLIETEAGDLEAEIRAAVAATGANRLLAVCGVGPIVAAKILGETHDVGRFSSAAAFAAHAGVAPLPASSGTISRWDPQGSAYLARKRAEGKTPPEARRCLMRHLAAVVYRSMVADAATARHDPQMGAA
jgi:transposase